MTVRGQTLIEVIVVITMGILVIVALVFATISSLRNSQFAKNQAQTTKLAQEGLEKVRILRDRDTVGSMASPYSKFSDLWPIALACPSSCYFYFNSLNVLISGTSVDFENISAGNFKRQFKIENYAVDQKKITSVVKWNDFSGDHESILTTILRKL